MIVSDQRSRRFTAECAENAERKSRSHTIASRRAVPSRPPSFFLAQDRMRCFSTDSNGDKIEFSAISAISAVNYYPSFDPVNVRNFP